MNRYRSRISSIVVPFLAACVFPCAPALSQIVTDTLVPQAPQHITVDQNNVEVTSGAVSFSVPELSIGSEEYGLRLQRFFDSRTGWRDSFTGILEHHMWGEYLSQYSLSASWGNQAWTFGASSNHSA